MSNPKEMCVKRQSFNSTAEILKKGGEFHTAKLVKLPIFGMVLSRSLSKKAGFPLNVLLEQAKICDIFGGHAALQHCCRNIEGKNHLMVTLKVKMFSL